MSSAEEPQSLRSLYEAAESKRDELDAIPSATSPSYLPILNQILHLYRQCLDTIASLSVFSPNEGLEDVSTSSIPYMITQYQLAELLQKTPTVGPVERRVVLKEARGEYEGFLSLLDSYGLVAAPYDKALERYRDDEDRFVVVAETDPAKRRDGKIANLKQEKKLRENLRVLQQDPRYWEDSYDEVIRELHLAEVQMALHGTFQSLDGLNREMEMLAMAPTDPPPYNHPSQNSNDPRSSSTNGSHHSQTDTKLDTPLLSRTSNGALLSRAGKPLQPFTLTSSSSNRAALASSVFRPGHNLPTMSIDEYLAEEKRRGGDSGTGGGGGGEWAEGCGG